MSLLVLALVYLAGCSSLPPAPERLAAMLADQVVHVPEHHLDPLLAEMEDKEIVFLGEVHNVPALSEAATDLAVGLASARPVVFAWEVT